MERSVLAGYGATLIAVSSLFNGFGRIVWGAVSERLGRINTFRLLLASQLIVFGMLMTEHNPWVFAVLVCYVLSCFGGGFAIMPSMVIDVYGPKRMSRVYGVILTAWSAAGILGPMMVASLKDNYPDRAIVYSFLLGILVLGVGFIFSFLVNDDRFIPRRILLQVFAGGATARCATPKHPRVKRLSRLCLPQTISVHNSKYRLPTMLEQRETRAADTEKISIKVTAGLKAVGTATDQRMQRFSPIPCPLATNRPAIRNGQ